MSLPPESSQAILVPEIRISVDGGPLPPFAHDRVTRASITRRMDPPDHFSLELIDPELDLVTPPAGPFQEGAKLAIDLGFHGDRQVSMSGTVTAVAAEFGPDGEPVVRVDGFDALHPLTRGTSYRVFAGQGDAGMADSEVVKKIASAAGLTGIAEEGAPRAVAPVQNHVSDLAFLRELATAGGYVIWVERQLLQVRKTRTAPAVVDLRRGDDLVSLRLRLSTTGQVPSVTVRGWDPVQKQAFTAEATRTLLGEELSRMPAGNRGRAVVIAHADVSSQAEALALAKSVMVDQGRSLVVGNGEALGRPDVDVGAIVRLHGTGRFDRGRYVVTEATHSIGVDGYRTEFRLNGAPGRTDLFHPADGNGSGAVDGMVAGLVTDNHDPQNRGRVKVRLAAEPNGAGELWARLASPMAGLKSGLQLVPEAGDEVLLAFENGHPDRPYVLGSLWNGKDAPPGDDPNVRILKSRSGHTVTLDDTAGAEKIEVVEKAGKSRIVLDSVTGAVTVHGGADVTVEAPNGTLKLHGNRVEVSADTSISVKATSTLDLAGNGPTTLKGATVDIN
jgi:phage protein D/phage baseplate assembly protein gpV